MAHYDKQRDDRQLGVGAHQDQTTAERIDRLRKRLADANERPAVLAAVLKGVLDLLADRL